MQLMHIYFYVPASHKEQVKEAMFHAGAGVIGHYKRCAFETIGSGQYEPMQNSQPFQGKLNQLEITEEVKVEMVCTADCLEMVISSLKQAHPYEEVAFGHFPINSYKH